jgi:hypothetical protein
MNPHFDKLIQSLGGTVVSVQPSSGAGEGLPDGNRSPSMGGHTAPAGPAGP